MSDEKTREQFIADQLRVMANSIEAGDATIVQFEMSCNQRTERVMSFNADEDHMGKDYIIGDTTGLTIELYRDNDPIEIRKIGWDGRMHDPDNSNGRELE